MLIPINCHLFLDDGEIEESFVRASGPGGQNVNKVSSAVQLRFDLSRSRSLPDDVRERLVRLAGRRLTRDGVIVIIAQRYRTQERNRQDALDRLIALIRRAAVPPTPRPPPNSPAPQSSGGSRPKHAARPPKDGAGPSRTKTAPNRPVF